LHLVGYLYNWQMGFNSVFKGLKHMKDSQIYQLEYVEIVFKLHCIQLSTFLFIFT